MNLVTSLIFQYIPLSIRWDIPIYIFFNRWDIFQFSPISSILFNFFNFLQFSSIFFNFSNFQKYDLYLLFKSFLSCFYKTCVGNCTLKVFDCVFAKHALVKALSKLAHVFRFTEGYEQRVFFLTKRAPKKIVYTGIQYINSSKFQTSLDYSFRLPNCFFLIIAPSFFGGQIREFGDIPNFPVRNFDIFLFPLGEIFLFIFELIGEIFFFVGEEEPWDCSLKSDFFEGEIAIRFRHGDKPQNSHFNIA